ncbi:hypothetical protein ILYODFUR_000466 [Ilyodon furcidens]|uniref:Uncharacterized protein n=1 Tax=Ilyodon furcidens TaxID=33524 RepID=A0ABV0SHB7_9TELE
MVILLMKSLRLIPDDLIIVCSPEVLTDEADKAAGKTCEQLPFSLGSAGRRLASSHVAPIKPSQAIG